MAYPKPLHTHSTWMFCWLYALQVLAPGPRSGVPIGTDYLAGAYHQPSGSHGDGRFGSEHLNQLYTPQSWQVLQNKGRGLPSSHLDSEETHRDLPNEDTAIQKQSVLSVYGQKGK